MAVIDRDPVEMLKFAENTNERISTLIYTIRTFQGLSESYKSVLNDDCAECIEELNTDCKTFLDQVEVYRTIAKHIERKAKRQMDIRLKKY